MFGLDSEYLRKFATLIALASAVTAVGIRIAVYEERQANMRKELENVQERIAFLESISRSRDDRDLRHSEEIKELREDIKELRR